jgi:hypothetical protein
MRAMTWALVTTAAMASTLVLSADRGTAPVTVSVTVVRSCRIDSEPAAVSVSCGRRLQPYRVSGAPASTTTTAPGDTARRSVTIDF